MKTHRIRNFKSLIKYALKSTVAKENYKPTDLRNVKRIKIRKL